MKKNLRLGLFGFGCVGQGLYHVLHETKGVKAEIKKVCVKNPEKKRPVADRFFTFDRNEILDDPEIDIVVELIDDAKAAYEIVKAALLKGKAVVTANKKMLAENLEELHSLQQTTGKPLLYEGSVCGSIPIIRNLEEYYDNDLISRLEGIFNGSTNFILSKVFDENKSYAEALKTAQELGFAESDPRLDVCGFDPKFKLVIAIAHAFGVFVQPDEVINIGIDRLSDLDVRFARENGYTIKLIARAFKSGENIFGFVAPQFVSLTNPLAAVRNEFNAVEVQGAFAEKQVFIGKGAGSYPTGSAVLSDVSALTYNYAYEYKKLRQANGLRFSNDLVTEAFITFDDGVAIGIGDFVEFKSGYAANGRHYMTGRITLEKLHHLAQIEGVGIILAPEAEMTAIAADEKIAAFA